MMLYILTTKSNPFEFATPSSNDQVQPFDCVTPHTRWAHGRPDDQVQRFDFATPYKLWAHGRPDDQDQPFDCAIPYTRWVYDLPCSPPARSSDQHRPTR